MEILTTSDKKEWNELLAQSERPDVYFTPEYCSIYEHSYSAEIDKDFCGKARLFVFSNSSGKVILPLIQRRINSLPFATDLPEQYDAVSPYGYSGPLIIAKTGRNQIAREFTEAYNKYCAENMIVASFIRFHPLLENAEAFAPCMPVQYRSETVYIDLHEQDLFKCLDRKTRNLVRKAEKNGITVEKSDRMEDVVEFNQLYTQTMARNQAGRKYFFPSSFFSNTRNALGKDCSLFVAKHQGKIVSAALFIHHAHFMHYHFSGSDKDYLKLAPNNLLLWTAMQWAKQHGYANFHLGGGVHGEDSLYHFKEGFGSLRAKFATAGIIHDQDKYGVLCAARNKFYAGKSDESFFPQYRTGC